MPNGQRTPSGYHTAVSNSDRHPTTSRAMAFRRVKVKSSLPQGVRSRRLPGTGSGPAPSPASNENPGSRVKSRTQLDLEDKEWAKRKAQAHAVSGLTSTAAVAAKAPGDDEPYDLDDLSFNPVPDSDSPEAPYMNTYVRFVEPRHVHLLAVCAPHPRYDPRTRTDRLLALQKAWEEGLPAIVNAFLAWHAAQSPVAGESSSTEPNMVSVAIIDIIGEKAYAPKSQVLVGAGETIAVALVRNGLLPCTPNDPTAAISIHLLDFYYRLRRRAPRLGIQAFAKALCDRYMCPYRAFLRDQLSMAFDAYLAILREVDLRVKNILKRSAPNWRVQNSCPPCRYKLEGEEPLIIPAFIAVDGGFSLKRSASAGLADPTALASDYKIDDANIDLYKDEVRKRMVASKDAKASKLGLTAEELSWETLNESGDPGDDSPDGPSTCGMRWKAAKAEHFKIAPTIFDQTGIYVSVCPHGLVMWYAEMRRSGELAKYGLGTIARIMSSGLAPVHVAADIGCEMQGTLSRSSLGQRANELGVRMCMNAFHGYGHNRLCQLKNHPLYQDGYGLADNETCERFFSSSNNVAPVVRHATHFHYTQAIDLFLHAWDEDKYAELSMFIYKNANQALRVIADFEPVLAKFKTHYGYDDATIESWRGEELRHLESLKNEPDEDGKSIDYIKALSDLDEIKAETDHLRVDNENGIVMFMPEDLAGLPHNQVVARATKARAAYDKYQLVISTVVAYERELGIERRWAKESSAYQETLKKKDMREFMRAVDRLELLMLQRMFELAKTHTYGTGYKLRESISKNIRARSKAIEAAVKNYNKAAASLNPPLPPADYTKLMEWTELQEFDMLRLSRNGDVRERAWAKPVNRSAAVKYYKVKRAREELQRCQIETRRLVTAMRDENQYLSKMSAKLQSDGHPLAAQVAELRQQRAAVNMRHSWRLQKLAVLPGFAASLIPGTQQGAQHEPGSGPSSSTEARELDNEQQDALVDEDNVYGDEDDERVCALEDFIVSLEHDPPL